MKRRPILLEGISSDVATGYQIGSAHASCKKLIAIRARYASMMAAFFEELRQHALHCPKTCSLDREFLKRVGDNAKEYFK